MSRRGVPGPAAFRPVLLTTSLALLGLLLVVLSYAIAIIAGLPAGVPAVLLLSVGRKG